MQKNFLIRLRKLEAAAGEQHLNTLTAFSDEQLDARILELSRKMGYEGPPEDCYAWGESIMPELRADIQREVEAGGAATKKRPI